MIMEIIFLGTTCMVPTRDRNHQSILFSHGNENILFDCGEGTQRQLKMADKSLMKITRILLSHWHGDHVIGLPGLLQTMSTSGYEGTLKIYGPKGTKSRIKKMFETFIFDSKIDLEVIEIKQVKVFESEKLKVEAYPLDHGIETYGFRIIEKDRNRINTPYTNKLKIPQGPLLGKLQEGKNIEWKGKKVLATDATYIVKGKIIGIINDTLSCSSCEKIAKDADFLISEAAFASNLEDKAIENKHMTSKQAALIAGRSNVKKLILTHFSARYKTTEDILNDAKDVFEDTVAAFDFMKIKI